MEVYKKYCEKGYNKKCIEQGVKNRQEDYFDDDGDID